VGSGSCPF